MTYGEVKASVLSILNRRDVTASQIESYTKQGIQRAQRSLRVPSMEKRASTTIATLFQSVPVPGDLIEHIAISCGGYKLVRKDLETVSVIAKQISTPLFWHRRGGSYTIAPTPVVGTVIDIDYIADYSGLSADSDTNFLTQVCPDLLTYAALSYLGDHFVDERTATWEGRYADIMRTLNDQAVQDEMVGASLSATYDYDT